MRSDAADNTLRRLLEGHISPGFAAISPAGIVAIITFSGKYYSQTPPENERHNRGREGASEEEQHLGGRRCASSEENGQKQHQYQPVGFVRTPLPAYDGDA
jgi:hypothetical protein